MKTPSWNNFNPTAIYFGDNLIASLGKHVSNSTVALITSPGFVKRGLVGHISSLLGNKCISIISDVKSNPTISEMDLHLQKLRPFSPEILVAIGGGSVIDTAKVLSKFLTQSSRLCIREHFNGVVFNSLETALPVIAVPTTAGTGSEVTPFATIWDDKLGNKLSLVGRDLYPKVALLDPIFLVTLPKNVIITTGLDAVSHAFESIWNRNANCITLSLAAASLKSSLYFLERFAHTSGDISEISKKMLEASLMAGLAISQTKTALSHAISYPLTAKFGLPHGIAASFCLPEVLRFNSMVDDGRLRRLSESLGFESSEMLALFLIELLHKLCIKDIVRSKILDISYLDDVIEKIISNERASNNMRQVTATDLALILKNSL